MRTDTLVRGWIVDVIAAHPNLVAIAVRQRAKFEGWLKFELAAQAQLEGATRIEVEASPGEGTRSRADLTFFHNERRCDVELKTCNSNWRMDGVLSRSRPITKNISEIVTDAQKLRTCSGDGIVAFCMFPVPSQDNRWTEYLSRIGNQLGLALSASEHSARVAVPLGGGNESDVVVVAFALPSGSKAMALPRELGSGGRGGSGA